ncbi:MAG: 4-hydroxy-3-methylbut-2-enyl diphosphate reductase [Gemmatimonadetes bacterium]|nr:4-hydroxy-3-methylbut-2-enyl diphosphate reductase [Gemmatimonadota bacterium]
MAESTYFRKGFGLKQEIEGALSSDYHSRLVDQIRSAGYRLEAGGLTFRLAKEFGFCYGVDRAVEYAYETREKFPQARIFLVGEIIHNPHVNRRLEEKDIAILGRPAGGEFGLSSITPADVVILPAFGVTVRDFQRLRDIGCILVDTTCGSVLNVWKRVEKYAKEGFTALVHGKHFHEETRATASQVTRFPGGKFLIVREMTETEAVCGFIERGGDPSELSRRFAHAVSEGFDFARDLERVGVANQTTMLAGESLAIAERVRTAFARRYGEDRVAEHFRSFDTICSATQERQDAVLELLKEPLDAMVVIGGYNSSNTMSLARICSQRVRTFHIEDASGIDPEAEAIHHQPIGSKEEVVSQGWLSPDVRVIGLTAGASTPNNKIGEAIVRILRSRGQDVPPELT